MGKHKMNATFYVKVQGVYDEKATGIRTIPNDANRDLNKDAEAIYNFLQNSIPYALYDRVVRLVKPDAMKLKDICDICKNPAKYTYSENERIHYICGKCVVPFNMGCTHHDVKLSLLEI